MTATLRVPNPDVPEEVRRGFQDIHKLPGSDITAADIVNYNTAYGWGDHAVESYLKNIVEDVTPQLGANLDGQAFDITTTGTVSAEHLISTDDATIYDTLTVGSLLVWPDVLGTGTDGSISVMAEGGMNYLVLSSNDAGTSDIHSVEQLYFRSGDNDFSFMHNLYTGAYLRINVDNTYSQIQEKNSIVDFTRPLSVEPWFRIDLSGANPVLTSTSGTIGFDDEDLTTTGIIQGTSITDGTATLTGGALTALGTLGMATVVNVTDIVDEDNMVSDSNQNLCTQQSIKKYVDDAIDGLSADYLDIDGGNADRHIDIGAWNFSAANINIAPTKYLNFDNAAIHEAFGVLILDAFTDIRLAPLTDNGFVKTGGGDGTLSVDTNTYLQDLVEDLSPQLGANLDGQAFDFTTTGEIHLLADASKLYFGGADDYTIEWDGADAVHTVVAGGFAFMGGRFGIGTTTPDALVHITAGSEDSYDIVFNPENGVIDETHAFAFRTDATAGYIDARKGLVYSYNTRDLAGGRNLVFREGKDAPVTVMTLRGGDNIDVLFGVDARIDGDSRKLHFGLASDAYFEYNGVDFNLVTDVVAASDFVVDCGANKTIELAEVVWKDINVGAAQLSRPAASQPSEGNFIDEAGADTGITTLAYSIGDKASGSFELQHDYKNGSDLTFHVHWEGIVVPDLIEYVQWRLTYTLMRDGSTLDAVTTFDSPDAGIDLRYKAIRSDFAAITGTNYLIGDQFLFTLERVSATGDDYPGDALVATIGVHYQVDTMGSRQILVK